MAEEGRILNFLGIKKVQIAEKTAFFRPNGPAILIDQLSRLGREH